jgi:arylsulfatase A-like enzyme
MSSPKTARMMAEKQTQPKSPESPRTYLLIAIAVWFGVCVGMLEGVGLLLFQRLNWRRWGAMGHVSKEIIWISPIVDVIFFAVLALLISLAARLYGRVRATRVLVFFLAFLSVYDWLTLTERLYHISCVLLALGVAAVFERWFQARGEAVVKFWKRSVPWTLALWLFVLLATTTGERIRERNQLAGLPTPRAGQPNVLVVVIDTLRADHLSAYGYGRSTTPNLDHIASQGVLLENAISACSWTLPSHSSILTGRYPSDHGMQNAQPMPWLGWDHKSLRGYLTLGEALEQRGYRTGAFSANQSYFTSNVGLGRGFLHFEDYFQSPLDMFRHTLYGSEFERVYLHRTEKSKITRAIRFLRLSGLLDIRKHADEVNREALAWIVQGHAPFFAFLNYIDVHDQAPPQDFKAPWGLHTEIDRYDSSLNYDDEQIGKLLQALERRGLTRNTLVIVTSDHGESLGQHTMQYHGIALYREQIHVPLIIRFPGRIPAGMTVTTPISNASLAATILDIVEGQKQTAFPGVGLDELWTNPDAAATWPNPVSELAKNDIVIDPDRQARDVEPTAMDGDMKSLITSHWHLIVHQTLGAQLYDWQDDPGELRNLVHTAPGAAAVKGLIAEIQTSTSP